jgi:hypothetical protein
LGGFQVIFVLYGIGIGEGIVNGNVGAVLLQFFYNIGNLGIAYIGAIFLKDGCSMICILFGFRACNKITYSILLALFAHSHS